MVLISLCIFTDLLLKLVEHFPSLFLYAKNELPDNNTLKLIDQALRIQS